MNAAFKLSCNFAKLGSLLLCLLISSAIYSQAITRDDNNNSSSDFVCPVLPIGYSINLSNTAYTNCHIQWSVTNGSIVGSSTSPTVSVQWQDASNTKAQLKCTLSGCTDSNGNSISGKEVSFPDQLILSVSGQSFGSSNNSVNVDYCTSTTVNITVPHMYVQGTGGIAQPPLQEVVYVWTIPAGWQASGNVTSTYLNGITIHPTACAKPGTVTVQGSINDRCGSAGLSNSTSISLNGVSPLVTFTVPQGYGGSTACNTTPVTFTALLSPSLGCVSGYDWSQHPSGWTPIAQSGNTATFRPSGSAADSDSPFRVKVNFSCGTSITSGPYTPPWIQPVIIGPSLICSTGTFSWQNAPGATPTWASSNENVLTINSSGVATSVSIGTATIYASCGSVSVSKKVWVGSANNSAGLTVSGSATPAPGGLYNYRLLGLLPAEEGPFTYTWRIPSGNGWSFFSQNLNTTTIDVWVGTTAGSVEAYWSNDCGQTGTYILVTPTGSGGGGGGGGGGPGPLPDPGPQPEIVISPNPSTTTVTVKATESLNRSALDQPYHLFLSDKFGRKVFSAQSDERNFDIPVSHLPEDIYYLNLIYKDVIVRKQIVIKR